MYLGKHIQVRGDRFPMVGLFPYDFVMEKRPQGHGYTTLEVVRENPFSPLGARLRGHEFHYSQISPEPAAEAAMAFRLTRGTGIGGQREGLIRENVLATYTHLHALGSPQWAPGLVRRAREVPAASPGPGRRSGPAACARPGAQALPIPLNAARPISRPQVPQLVVSLQDLHCLSGSNSAAVAGRTSSTRTM